MRYTYLTEKFWIELIYQIRLKDLNSAISILENLPKTEHNYWVLVDALDKAERCVKQYQINPQANYKILTPVQGRINRKGFHVNQYTFELLVIAIQDEIQERN